MKAADAELGEQLALLFSGDKDSLAAGVALLDQRLRHYFLRELLNRYAHLQQADAEDIWQKSLFKIWVRASTINFDGNWLGLIWTIVRNCCMDEMRQRRTRVGLLVPETAARADPSGTPEEEAILAEQTAAAQRVLELIDQLPEPERAILSLLRTGKKYREIADTLKMKPGTVASHIFRSLNKLRKMPGISPEDLF